MLRSLIPLASAAAIATAAAASTAGQTLLDARFAPRAVAQIEVGDFHFRPGQKAPVHTHAAPAYGYVSKGRILYQVEGRKPVMLNAGDAFIEPVGPRILHFDNASATEEAVFTDFNPERSGEPFIVFPKPPTEAIDRRSFSTVAAAGQVVDRVVATAQRVAAGSTLALSAGAAPLSGYVAAGTASVQVDGAAAVPVTTGTSFAVPAGGTARVTASSAAKLVTFKLSKSRRS